MRKHFVSVVCLTVILVVILVLVGTSNILAQGTTGNVPNLLPNPSFESQRITWRKVNYRGEAALDIAENTAKTGQKSAVISSSTGADSSWATSVAVHPNARYKLSGWVKTENVQPLNGGTGVLFNVHEIQSTGRTPALTGTHDWTLLEKTFQTDGQDNITINCLFGGWGTATGTAWFDDVKLELLESFPLKSPVADDWVAEVAIDLNRKNEPLTPLIYGQFIEHLGRCIYGGIWAEMLEDRKFWYSIDDKDSFWKPLDGTKVHMDTNSPFVGKHTPVATLEDDGDVPKSFGISQTGLAMKKGMKYTGYVWVKPSEGVHRVSVYIRYKPNNDRTRFFTWVASKLDGYTKRDGYTKLPFEWESPFDADDVTIEISAVGKGSLAIGTASVMPENNINGMRADTLALLKELNSPVYRWPGGNFVSGYDWKDGIGDRDKRPPRKNPAWKGVEHNDFGIDEFLVFCRYLGTEPYIAVNTGNGQVANALDELMYSNGPADSPMGKLRATNGHPEPYNVYYWGIGNEMYGNWQIGHIPVTEYVKKSNEFVEAFRKADPSIHVITVGNVGPWDEAFLPGTAAHTDSISEHFYTQTRNPVLDHVRLVPSAIKRIADAHRNYRKTMPELQGKDIRIAMDEWNYWYGPHLFGELGTRYFVKDGLGVAAGIHEFARQSELYMMANYAQTVNVIGCIKTNKTDSQFETTGLVLKLYRHEFGSIPLVTSVTNEGVKPVDVQAALTEDGKTLTVGIVNTLGRNLDVKLSAVDVKWPTQTRCFIIADPENDPMAYNDPSQKQRIHIVETIAKLDGGKVTVQPYSVTLLKIPL